MRDVVRVPPTHEAPSRRALAQIASAALVATCVVFVPQLVTDAGQTERLSPLLNLAWLVLLLCVPAVAGVTTRRLGVPADDRRALLVGLPQVVAVPSLVRLDVWLEVRSGYLIAGSGEEAMSYGIGSVLGLVVGLVLVLLVSAAARLGSRARNPDPSLNP